MATGTGKTYTTFQIIWRLWKAKAVRRILFLVDRNILADQTLVNDFKPFGSVMAKVGNRKIDPSYEIHLALYQAITGIEEEDKIFKNVSPDFFDLIVIDECHRGSAAEDSAWREILNYFAGAIPLGMTATPKETKYISNLTYFGDPVYTYSLKQGIEDGFLAPYKVIRIHIDKDIEGWRPPPGMKDDLGKEIESRIYNQNDMDKILVLNQRTKLVARRVMRFLGATDSNATHQNLLETLLPTLTTAADHDEFAGAWQRIKDHFHTLFTTDQSIDQLKQTILQLAVMGKLVPQDPSDEPASVLLEKIAEEKGRLIKEGKIKKQKKLPEIREEEKSFDLPEGWDWARFLEVSQEISTGPFGTVVHKQDYVEGGIPLINPSHMVDCVIVEQKSVTVSLKKAKELSSYKLAAGDIVMARRGELGRCAVVTEAEDSWLCGTGSFRLKFHSDLSRRYITLLFKTSNVKKYLGGKSVGATMSNLNHGILKKMPVPLPPTPEQYRIVAKVDELMTLCDTLKTRLSEAQTTQIHLADTIVEQAVSCEAVQ